ncbi:MAG: LON peptidase substrate-binding domain-containing protein, partial [Armatimonadetes bacterium]|nr:LON peptidase substrate-binding domain-containing protein [Armatimonadota bacterium]
MPDPAPPTPKPARKPRARRNASSRLRRDEIVLPLIPIRDQVYFPQGIFSILVGRDRSVRAVEAAMESDRKLVLLAQRDLSVEDPVREDLFDVGITASVMQVLRVPDGTLRVVLEGVDRVNVLSIDDEITDHTLALVVRPDELPATGAETEACMRLVKAQFETLVHTSHQIAPEALLAVMNGAVAGEVADTIVPYLRHTDIAVRQELLETLSPDERLQKLAAVLARETEVAELQRVIRERVEQTMGENQREVILREQLRAIHSELGEVDDHAAEMAEYGEKIAAAGLEGVALERAEKELQRLTRMPGPAPEAGIIRNYLDWLVGLPWSTQTEDSLDLAEAVRALDEDHYGLSKPKERIIEFLAVRRLAGDAMRGPILCFVGPPGVG